MLIQLVEKGNKNYKQENLDERTLYASLKEQPLLLSISWDPSSAQN